MSEEGEKCQNCESGVLEFTIVKSCSCHINPPCSACVDAPLKCNNCGFEEEIEHLNGYRMVVDKNTPERRILSYRERALDKTKIDWHSKPHTNFTMIKEGVYPEGTTREQVLEKIEGTFGGRFDYFEKGKFKYIAYTD